MPKHGYHCGICQAARESGLGIDPHKYDYLHAEMFDFDYTTWMEKHYRLYCTCWVCHRCNTLVTVIESRLKEANA